METESTERIRELLDRNLQEVFGEADDERRRVALDALWAEDGSSTCRLVRSPVAPQLVRPQELCGQLIPVSSTHRAASPKSSITLAGLRGDQGRAAKRRLIKAGMSSS